MILLRFNAFSSTLHHYVKITFIILNLYPPQNKFCTIMKKNEYDKYD